MRILVPVLGSLVVAGGIASTVLLRETQSDRQLINDLRTQLTDAKTALAAKSATRPGVETASASPADVQVAGDAPAAPPAKITREAAIAALTAETVKRQKTLLADPEYRKALLAQARVDLQQHYSRLGVELGLSGQEMEKLFDLLSDAQANMMVMPDLPNGATPDAATTAALQRQMEQQGQKTKDAITALLGAERYGQFEDYDRIQPSRTRVNNLTNLLAKSGQPLNNAQTRSLTAVMVAEQNRMEAEAKAIRDAGQTDKRAPADIQAETNRRLLEQVPSFLNAQQVQLLRGRFEERSTIDRAADRVQQREREVLQESPNGR